MSIISVLTVVLVVGGILVALAVLQAKVSGAPRVGADASKFKKKSLLTANELEFLNRLESAVPEYRFCPQVSMAALLDPAVSRKDSKAYYRARGMFAQKIVDFVVQDRITGIVLGIIELDDRTHDGQKDAKRDLMLVDAGYKIFRWNSKTKPSTVMIRAELISKNLTTSSTA